jgi:hypothetical protein
VVGSSEHGYEFLGFIFLDHMSDCYFLKKDSAIFIYIDKKVKKVKPSLYRP